MDVQLAVAGFLVGVVVGMTGMGGGALMTPILVLFFNVPPLAAVSSDLVASAVMKPVGSVVHLRRGTVDLRLVGWLCAGSVPAAFAGVLLARALGDGEGVQDVIRLALGIALLVAATGLIVRSYIGLTERAARRDGRLPPADAAPSRVTVRRVPTVLVGIVGGLVVGMTSVGSGSLIIIALLALYPSLRAGQLVGTDLVQAVPLVISAAIGHLLFGQFSLGITTSLLVGSIPGVYLGARLSSSAPSGVVRRALALVLLASALKLFELSNVVTGAVLLGVVLVGPPLWMLARRRHGFPALAPRRLRAPSGSAPPPPSPPPPPPSPSPPPPSSPSDRDAVGH